MSTSIDKNKALVRRFVEEVWNLKQGHLLEQFFAKEFAISTADGLLFGAEGYLKIYNTYTEAFPDCEIKIADILAEGSQVVTRYVFKGTHQGVLLGIKPTGRMVSIPGISIMRILNGQIVDQQVVWDTLSMMEQLHAVTLGTEKEKKE